MTYFVIIQRFNNNIYLEEFQYMAFGINMCTKVVATSIVTSSTMAQLSKVWWLHT